MALLNCDWHSLHAMQIAKLMPSTARRQYVASSFRRSAWQNNAFPRAKLARYVRYAVLVRRPYAAEETINWRMIFGSSHPSRLVLTKLSLSYQNPQWVSIHRSKARAGKGF